MKLSLNCLIVFIAILTIHSARANDYRMFHDSKGREVEACLRGYTPKTKTVKIELKNGKVRNVNISIFSKDDISFIKEWHMGNALLSSSKLRVTVGKKSVDSGELSRFEGGWSAYDPGLRFKDFMYDIKIENRSGMDINNLRVEYRIYKESTIDETVRKLEYREELKGTVPLSSKKLPRRTEVACVSDVVKITSIPDKQKHSQKTNILQVRNGNAGKRNKELTQGNYQTIDEDLLGIRIRLYLTMESGNEIMNEYSYPSDLKKKTEWVSSNKKK